MSVTIDGYRTIHLVMVIVALVLTTPMRAFLISITGEPSFGLGYLAGFILSLVLLQTILLIFILFLTQLDKMEKGDFYFFKIKN